MNQKVKSKTNTDMGFESMPSAGEKFYDEEIVNGTEIMVGWSAAYGEQTIYFPQIDTIHAYEEGPHDSTIRIGKDAEVAKKVFEYAKEQAAREKDIHNIYKRVYEYVQEIKRSSEKPDNFDEVLAEILLKKKEFDNITFLNILNDLEAMAEGKESYGVRKYYPGWTNDDFKFLVKKLKENT